MYVADESVPVESLHLVADGSEKVLHLPGRSETAEQQALSGRQVNTILPYLQAHFAGKTFGEACAEARSRFGVRGNSADWNLVGAIIEESRAQNSGDPLSPRQEQLMDTVLKSLVTGEHWDPAIAIALRRPNLTAARNRLIEAGAGVFTRGQFTAFMNRFGTLFGTPTRSDPARQVTEVEGEAAQEGDAY